MPDFLVVEVPAMDVLDAVGDHLEGDSLGCLDAAVFEGVGAVDALEDVGLALFHDIGEVGQDQVQIVEVLPKGFYCLEWMLSTSQTYLPLLEQH